MKNLKKEIYNFVGKYGATIGSFFPPHSFYYSPIIANRTYFKIKAYAKTKTHNTYKS
mgnify:CR=1 FL=1